MIAGTSAQAKDLARSPYPIRIYKDRESDDWVAEVTDLPGCIGVGDTREEALEVAQSFISTWIEDAIAAGNSVPLPSQRSQASGRFVVRVPRSLHARLQALAQDEATSLNQLVVMLLSEAVTTSRCAAAPDSTTISIQETDTASVRRSA
jgi:predicted RNase H-like HicB family nuclease